jgi:DNA-binding FrmR family transcriptional regulator
MGNPNDVLIEIAKDIESMSLNTGLGLEHMIQVSILAQIGRLADGLERIRETLDRAIDESRPAGEVANEIRAIHARLNELGRAVDSHEIRLETYDDVVQGCLDRAQHNVELILKQYPAVEPGSSPT